MALLLAAACSSPAGAPATSTTTIPAATTTGTVTTPQPSVLERTARTVLMTTLRSTSLTDDEHSHLARGGRAVVLFGPNIADPAQLTRLTAEVACAADRRVLIAVDQELAPAVRRLGAGMVTPLPEPDEARNMPLEEVHAAALRLGREMLNFGINVDLAPVVDVVEGDNPALEGRHLGGDPDIVGAIGAAIVAGLVEAGVVAVPKHFPGHGRTTTDPHDEAAIVEATERDLSFTDWPPFEAVISAGAAAVMIGHPVYRALDPERPASLSPAVYALLRDRFGFDGVVVTDALGMAAITSFGSSGEIAVIALAAGADLLLLEDPLVVEEVVGAIVGAALDGTLDRERLAEAAGRVDRLAEAAARVRCTP